MITHKKAKAGKGDKEMSEKEISLGEKIMLLREIEIFSDLKVAELAAIAAVTEEVSYPPEQTVFEQEDEGDTVFMVISGLVEVVRELSPEDRVVLDTIGRGGAFGEMALLDDSPRSATIQTVETSRFLTLHKQAFNETVMEYPRIALQICPVLSRRIRHLHGKIDQRLKKTAPGGPPWGPVDFNSSIPLSQTLAAVTDRDR